MNEETIEMWFQLYGHDVFNYLVYYTYSRDVEDLVRKTFIKAWFNLRKRRIEDPKAWLLSIARNTAIDAIRKRKRPIEQTVSANNMLSSLESDFSVEAIVQFNEEKRRILSALFTLKPSYRDVVILRAFQDLSIADTASVLGWPESK